MNYRVSPRSRRTEPHERMSAEDITALYGRIGPNSTPQNYAAFQDRSVELAEQLTRAR